MKSKWISPKIIVGSVAKGNFYYPRPDIVEEIWEELEKGNNVLIAAPRRVGKSSVMVYMAANCPKGYQCDFETIQGVQTEVELYKRFYGLVVKCLKPHQKTVAWIKEVWKEH